MALRDELIKLDFDVAAGRISAEEFHTQRDHLLASAGSGPATGGPFSPPFRWDGPQAPAEDRTQVVRRATPPASDRTQVVSGATPPAEDRTQVVSRVRTRSWQPPAGPPADADRTQVVRAGRPPSGYWTLAGEPDPMRLHGKAQDPPAQNPLRPEGTLPPWTLGPQVRAGQRPNGFASADALRANGFRAAPARRWLLPLVVVVVLAIVVGSCLYFLL